MKSETDTPRVIFTDGASSGNPGPGGWGIIQISPDHHVQEKGGGEIQTTNNQMELKAAIEALRGLNANSETARQNIWLYTDSTYLIRGITQWVWNWQKKSWKSSDGNTVANSDLWKELLLLSKGLKITWKYVRGHTSVPGNERADEIAVAFSKGKKPVLFSGNLSQYSVPIFPLPPDLPLPKMTIGQATKVKDKPISYLSLINGVPMRHSNWPDCQKRVQGISGAKFKKAMTPEEEAEILAAWGYQLEDLDSV